MRNQTHIHKLSGHELKFQSGDQSQNYTSWLQIYPKVSNCGVQVKTKLDKLESESSSEFQAAIFKYSQESEAMVTVNPSISSSRVSGKSIISGWAQSLNSRIHAQNMSP